jgi:hypothetical protein
MRLEPVFWQPTKKRLASGSSEPFVDNRFPIWEAPALSRKAFFEADLPNTAFFRPACE